MTPTEELYDACAAVILWLLACACIAGGIVWVVARVVGWV